MAFWDRFARHTAQQEADVTVGLAGAGNIGAAIADRVTQLPGMRIDVVVNRTTATAVEALRLAGLARDEIEVVGTASQAAAARRRGRVVVTDAGDALWELDDLDLVVEATGAVGYGSELILSSLERGRDVVNMNAEADALLGPSFFAAAERSGAVYTISDGDQPGVLFRLVDEVTGYGFRPIAALNCKRHLDVHQDPDVSRQYSNRDNVSILMSTAFGDGTKLQIEQSVVANTLGYDVLSRGMTGIDSTLATVAEDVGAVVGDDGPVADFTLGGDFGGGVVVVAVLEDEPRDDVLRRLRLLKMGDGPFYSFFRPWHLVSHEVPTTIATVAMDRLPIAAPSGPPTTSVAAIAKRDLASGDQLDGLGGFTVYGHVERIAGAADHPPIGLLDDATVTRAVGIDEPVTWDDVEPADERLLRRWRAQRDRGAA